MTIQRATLIKGHGIYQYEQLKHLNLKIQEVTLTEKKEKQYIKQIILTNQASFTYKNYPNINFTGKTVKKTCL